MRMVITLKSGVQIKIPVTTFTTGASPIGGELRRLEWELDGAPAADNLSWIDLSEVAAVHAERGPDDAESKSLR